MIKDYLKENQPLFYRIIENEFNLKKIPHASYLLEIILINHYSF